MYLFITLENSFYEFLNTIYFKIKNVFKENLISYIKNCEFIISVFRKMVYSYYINDLIIIFFFP